ITAHASSVNSPRRTTDTSSTTNPYKIGRTRPRRAPSDSSADWVDEAGRTYDAVGNFPGQYFDRQWPQLQYQIERHLEKADLVPVDVSRFSAQQTAMVEQFIADRGFGPRIFIVGK
ncbi:hypothetical protein ACWEEK_33195, partial [Micromonospora aurantiaca (nom. illeg.)]